MPPQPIVKANTVTGMKNALPVKPPVSTSRISSYDKAVIPMDVGFDREFKLDPMNCVLENTQDLGKIYLGNIEAATSVGELQKHNIEAVLTVALGMNISYD